MFVGFATLGNNRITVVLYCIVYFFLLVDKCKQKENTNKRTTNFSTKRGGSENSSKKELNNHSEGPLDKNVKIKRRVGKQSIYARK